MFFTNQKKVTNKYFTFNRIIDNDNICVVTNNIKFWKGQPVLILDKNHVVYLKDWNVIAIRNYQHCIYGYAVKLNRQYFKVYETKFDIEDFSESDECMTFDSWYEIAKEQQNVNLEFTYDL